MCDSSTSSSGVWTIELQWLFSNTIINHFNIILSSSSAFISIFIALGVCWRSAIVETSTTQFNFLLMPKRVFVSMKIPFTGPKLSNLNLNISFFFANHSLPILLDALTPNSFFLVFRAQNQFIIQLNWLNSIHEWIRFGESCEIVFGKFSLMVGRVKKSSIVWFCCDR